MPPHAPDSPLSPHGLKKRLFRISGPGPYRLLHAAWFFLRLLRALRSKAYADRFFGNDVMAFAQRLRPGSLVLDIGAFLGGSTALFAGAVGASGRVIAFEPVHHRFLRALLSALRLSQARVEPIALAAENGATELVIPIRGGVPLYSQAGFPASYPAAAQAGSGYAFQRLPTSLMRLDDFLARESLRPEDVSAVKVDVEGSELSLFAGGEDFFRRFRGSMLCEFWFHEMPPAGWTWLRERGYSCRYLDRRGRWTAADTPEALAALCRGETYGNFFWERA
ncbi:MAG TPA: FkbM family methyltransferase [Fibrobacteria bacterium]|nr:FkbM family methyltransferase [Fibrobacteria bacterium]